MATVEETNSSDTTLAQESSINDSFTAPARFECPICLAWLRDPVLTSCGHRFCRSCIQSWLERENACPVDNMKLQKDTDIFPDNFTRREISQQRTKCPNIVRGCLVELAPLDVDAHMLVCEFRPPELPVNEKLRCYFVEFGCDDKFEDEPELQQHMEKEMGKHLLLISKNVNKATTNGELAGAAGTSTLAQANFWDPPSKNESVTLSQDENLQNLLKALYEKIIILEQKSREQDIINVNMSKQIVNLNEQLLADNYRNCNGCFIWSFKDFKSKINAMKENPRLMHYSPGFYTSRYGYRFCIRLNLSPKDNNYLAILVHLMKTEHDNTLTWPFSGKLTVTVVHPSQQFKHIKETLMTRPDLEAFNRPSQELNPKGFGYTEFTHLEELIGQDFIQNNQLIVKVEAHAV